MNTKTRKTRVISAVLLGSALLDAGFAVWFSHHSFTAVSAWFTVIAFSSAVLGVSLWTRRPQS